MVFGRRTDMACGLTPQSTARPVQIREISVSRPIFNDILRFPGDPHAPLNGRMMIVQDQKRSGPEKAGPGNGVGPAGSMREALVRRDQLEAMRGSILTAIPVNMLLGLASVLVAFRSDHGSAGAAWFAVSTAVNLLR